MEQWKIDTIIKLKDHRSNKEIATLIGCDPSTVTYYLKKIGYTKNKISHLNCIQMQYLIAAFDMGIGYKEISKNLGVTVSVLQSFITSMGWTRYKVKKPGRIIRSYRAKKVSNSDIQERIAKSELEYAKKYTKCKRKTSKRRWTRFEIRELEEMLRSNVPIEVIGYRLDRSDESIKAMIYKVKNNFN